MLQRQTPHQPLELRDMGGILAVGVLWTFTRRRRVPQEYGLPIGQDRVAVPAYREPWFLVTTALDLSAAQIPVGDSSDGVG